MAKKFDVLCLGAAIVDLPLKPVSKAIFEKEASYPVDGIRMAIGGDAINEATILKRLGHRVSLAGCVGNDVPGKFVLDHCAENEIDTTYMSIRERIDTSINVALVTADGERTMITNRQGSLWKFCEDDFDMAALNDASVISFSFFNTPLMTGKVMEKIFAKAKENGMLICADMIKPRLGETLEDIRGALQYVDYFFPNEEEARILSQKTDVDEIADVFLECGVKHVIVKTDDKKCLIKSKKERHLVPGYEHSVCVDTIGAGDNFEAGFITAILEGKDFRSCAEFAHSVASISVESAGATAGVRSREQVEERYQKYLCSK